MNIFEIAEKGKVSLSTLRRLEKLGALRTDGISGEFDEIRAGLMKGNEPSAMHLVTLIENRAGLLELGKYAETATRALAAVGEAQSQAAPREVGASILAAAKDEPEAVDALEAWLKQTLAHGRLVSHAYIATRLLLGIPASLRKAESVRIPRALLNVRKRASFANYWHSEKGTSRNRTFYQKKGFDL